MVKRQELCIITTNTVIQNGCFASLNDGPGTNRSSLLSLLKQIAVLSHRQRDGWGLSVPQDE
jgi:hypothetical protein